MTTHIGHSHAWIAIPTTAWPPWWAVCGPIRRSIMVCSMWCCPTTPRWGPRRVRCWRRSCWCTRVILAEGIGAEAQRLEDGVFIMALQDHFRPPLSMRRHWHAFHNAWATYIASDLNQQLPEGYFAEANVQFGIEIDVAAFEEIGREATHHASPRDGI